jgi:cytochrome c oxidase assembly protein subunit 15
VLAPEFDVMSQSVAARRGFGWLTARVGLRHLLAATLGLVAATILLGVAAKATGSGLACQANWPQCDAGPWNLFPASLPSFYEWIHRFVAMVAGVAIVGSAVAALVSAVDRRVLGLVLAGTLLTPVQVYLGRETVFEYQLQVLALHFWTAMSIFGVFTVATGLLWRERLTGRHRTLALGGALVALAGHIALSPAAGLVAAYGPTMQLLQYAAALTLLGTVTLAALVSRWQGTGRLGTVLPVAAALALAVAYLGRQNLTTVDPAVTWLYLGMAAVLGVVLGAALRASQGGSQDGTPAAV